MDVTYSLLHDNNDRVRRRHSQRLHVHREGIILQPLV
jgi:hypothetical protein